MVTKRREEVRGLRRGSKRRRCWQMQLRLRAGKSGSVSSAQRPMCGPVGVAGVVSLTSQHVRKESTRRLSLKRIKGWYSGSSSSSSEERKPSHQEEELKMLRANLEPLSKQKEWG